MTLEWSLPEARPVPPRRYAAPMGPWPWVDRPGQQTGFEEDAMLWDGYPQSQFPNWTPAQIRASGIAKAIKAHTGASVLYVVDIMKNGEFTSYNPQEITNNDKHTDELRPRDISTHAIFVENLGGNALQILGSRYNIEPFFFSSSLNYIPTRYAEDIRPMEGDHITIILTFLRVEKLGSNAAKSTRNGSEVIDTHAPLVLHSLEDSHQKVTSRKVFMLDLLAIHVVRDCNSSTIISYHPATNWTTSAKELHARIKFAGDSVYWQKIFKKGRNSSDPTFVLLAILWHAMYSWDEALEVMYTHFCLLESQVMDTNDMKHTEELHIIRAHLLHYVTLLQDFKKSVEFVMKTPNPAMDAFDEDERKQSQKQLRIQCGDLLSEVSRLELWIDMLDKRVKNVTDLLFAMVNVHDSAAMKLISYFTMVFMPATFVSGLFGMNLKELNGGNGTIASYIATAIPFMLLTIWIIVAYRTSSALHWYSPAVGPVRYVQRRWRETFSRHKIIGLEEACESNAYVRRLETMSI